MNRFSLSSVFIATLISLALLNAAPLAQAADAPVGTVAPLSTTPAPAAPSANAILAPQAPVLAAKSWLLLNVTSNQILTVGNPDMRVEPASLTKLMTAYLSFKAIRQKSLSLNTVVSVSPRAWKAEGSRMFIEPNRPVTVDELLHGMIIQSGNDASIALAERIGTSEEQFAQMMNQQAAALGMTNTHFMNATGLPDPQHYSTPRDLATLAVALIRDFPEDYHYFSETEFTYNKIKQGNRNPLLYRNMNVDGLKTGHADAAGYGLTASAIRGGRRLVMVLNGMKDMQARADESAHVLDYGYREFGLYPVAKANEQLGEAKVWMGQAQTVPVVASQDIALTLPRAARAGLKTAVTFDQPVQAPIAKGQLLGSLTVTAPTMEPKVIPLVAGSDVARLGFFARLGVKIHMLFNKS